MPPVYKILCWFLHIPASSSDTLYIESPRHMQLLPVNILCYAPSSSSCILTNINNVHTKHTCCIELYDLGLQILIKWTSIKLYCSKGIRNIYDVHLYNQGLTCRKNNLTVIRLHSVIIGPEDNYHFNERTFYLYVHVYYSPVGRNFQRGARSIQQGGLGAAQGSQKPLGIWCKILQSSNFWTLHSNFWKALFSITNF